MHSYGKGGADTRAPAAGWTKAESLLGGGKLPLSENTRAVWARQDRAKRQRKQQMKNGLLLLPMVIFLGSSLPAPLRVSQIFRRTLFLRTSTNLKVATGEKILQIISFSLKCRLERISQSCRANGSSALILCLGCQGCGWLAGRMRMG